MSLPITRTFGTALVTLCVIACSGTPKQAEAPAPAPATLVAIDTTANGSAPEAASAANAAAADTEMVNGVSREANAKLLAQGYKPVAHDGGYVYCRNETMTGTHIRQKV